jgi:S1-C subfamily serine protease
MRATTRCGATCPGLVLGLVLSLLLGCGRGGERQATRGPRSVPPRTAAAPVDWISDSAVRTTVGIVPERDLRGPRDSPPREIGTPLKGAGRVGAVDRAERESPRLRLLQRDVHPVPAYGAGVVIDGHGLVLTSARLVRHVTRVQVVWNGGAPVAGRVTAVDLRTGLAVVQTQLDLRVPAMRYAKRTGLGEHLIAVGSPGKLPQSVSWCTVAHMSRGLLEVPDIAAIQLSGIGGPGYEGGPVFTSAGELLGIALDWPVTPEPMGTLAFATSVRGGEAIPDGAPGTDRPPSMIGFVIPVAGVLQRLVQ